MTIRIPTASRATLRPHVRHVAIALIIALILLVIATVAARVS
ncbi:MAG TPA: hypothetical protein VLB75_01995 [Steroidobacteraceae bacterium]|nr:hypothetical protein [Steroidobacteraceae bacterium]